MKIKWGVLGTANIAKNETIPGMLMAQNCELTAIAGRDIEKAESFKAEFGFKKAYGSYDELLADPEVQAVYIPLPNNMHFEWTLKALRAKKHVLCEKPIAPSQAHLEEMIACARENGVFLMEAFAYLHSPFMSALKEDLRLIGDILYAESAFIISDLNPANIRMRRETLGGCTYDLGCYPISQMLWLLEEEPDTVQACATFSDKGIDTFTTGLFTFKSGITATFRCGMVLAADKGKRILGLQIHGTKGFIRAEVRFNQCGDITYTVSLNEKTETRTISVPHNYKLEIEQMGNCIAGESLPHVSNEFSLANIRTIDRVLSAIGY